MRKKENLNISGWSSYKSHEEYEKNDTQLPKRESNHCSRHKGKLVHCTLDEKQKYLPPITIQTDEIRVKSERPILKTQKVAKSIKCHSGRPVSQPSIPSISTPFSSNIHINGSYYFPAKMIHMQRWKESVQKSLRQIFRDRREFTSLKSAFRSPRNSTITPKRNDLKEGFKAHMGHNDHFLSPMPSETSFCYDRYSMRRKPRGCAVIINNYEYFEYVQPPNDRELVKRYRPDMRRDGAEVDTDLLQSLFGEELHFNVKAYTNLTRNEMISTLSDIAELDHDQFDCFVCCLCSHGNDGTISGSDCREVRIIELTRIFDNNRCISLQDKPKCFFIQACQGNVHQKDISQIPTSQHEPVITLRDTYIPQTSDVLVGYSSIGGHTSFRHALHGSVYIVKLVKYIRKYRKICDVLSILTKVNKMVSGDKFSIGHGHGRQMPKIESTLRAQLYFDD